MKALEVLHLEDILTYPVLFTKEHDATFLHSCLAKEAKQANKHNTLKEVRRLRLWKETRMTLGMPLKL